MSWFLGPPWPKFTAGEPHRRTRSPARLCHFGGGKIKTKSCAPWRLMRCSSKIKIDICLSICLIKHCIYIYIYIHIYIHIYMRLKATRMIPVASRSTPFSNSLPKQSSPFTRGSPPVCLGYVTAVTRAQPQVSITADQWLTWSPQVGTCIHRNHSHIEWNIHISWSPRKGIPIERLCTRLLGSGLAERGQINGLSPKDRSRSTPTGNVDTQ